MFEKWFPNVDITELWTATYETLYMTVIALVFHLSSGDSRSSALLTGKGSLWENKIINTVIAAVVNIFRSIPFLILIILLLGFTKILVGSILGPNAALPALIIGSRRFTPVLRKLRSGKSIKESSKLPDQWEQRHRRLSSKC